MQGFRLWNTHKLYAPRCPDSAEDDYNLSLYGPKMAPVRYFDGLWMTFNEELQGQISACLQRTYIYVYTPTIG